MVIIVIVSKSSPTKPETIAEAMRIKMRKFLN